MTVEQVDGKWIRSSAFAEPAEKGSSENSDSHVEDSANAEVLDAIPAGLKTRAENERKRREGLEFAMIVVGARCIAGPFDTNASAWRWIDRHQGEPVSRSEHVTDWLFRQKLCEPWK